MYPFIYLKFRIHHRALPSMVSVRQIILKFWKISARYLFNQSYKLPVNSLQFFLETTCLKKITFLICNIVNNVGILMMIAIPKSMVICRCQDFEIALLINLFFWLKKSKWSALYVVQKSMLLYFYIKILWHFLFSKISYFSLKSFFRWNNT